MTARENQSFIFFGTPDVAVIVLEELAHAGFLPATVVTSPDRPSGRGLNVTSTPVKVWAVEREIPVLTPEKLDAAFIESLHKTSAPFAIVAAYGKILPKNILDAFPRGLFNIHPSLLPRYRGATPVESAILNDDTETGVSIIKLDEQMDHGPILAQEKVPLLGIERAHALKEKLFKDGAALLARSIPDIAAGNIKLTPQDDAKATYTNKILNDAGLLDLAGSAEENYRKIRALADRGDAYAMIEKKDKSIRVAIKDARVENGKLIVTRATPAGKKEMSEREFAHWLSN